MKKNIFILFLSVIIFTFLYSAPAYSYLIEPETIFNNNNIYTVYNNPSNLTVFSITKEYYITEIETYHWNGQRGKSPGQISIKGSDGTIYGPWDAVGRKGYKDVPNAYWTVEPNLTIKPGTYTILDSGTSTWSHNSASDNRGMAKVKGIAPLEQNNDLISNGIIVKELKFFEAGAQAPERDQRQFSETFSKENARYLYFQLRLGHPNLTERIDFTLTCRYLDPDGNLFGEFESDSYILESWDGSYHYNGYGWSSPGNWETGTYTVQILQVSTELASGTFSITEGSSTLPPDEWLTTFPVSVDESNVDDFFPVPEFPTRPFNLKRSYDPFGSGSEWFETSKITTGAGGLRISEIILDDMAYWFDMQINLSDSRLPLQIIDLQAGDPNSSYSDWYLGNDIIDFRMSKAEILGPPPYISFINLGIDGVVYDLEFQFDGKDFAFSKINPSGYIHYLPSPASPELGVITSTPDTPLRSSGQDSLCFSNVPYGAPLAIFNVDHPDGEDYLNIDYCYLNSLQKFVIQDGVAVGTYAPLAEQSAQLFSLDSYTLSDQSGGWWSSPSLEEKLEECIKDQTNVNIGLQRDNQLDKALFDLAFSFAGKLNLSSKTMNAAKDALTDSKDVIWDAVSTGRLKSESLGKFVLATLLKKSTPEEHENFVDLLKIPDHAQNIAQGAGTAQEKQYKTALLGILKNEVKTYFPTSSAMAETLIESKKWAIEFMADEDIQNLYAKYKNNNANWEDTKYEWNTMSNYDPNLRMKIKQILKKQGKSTNEENIASYIKNRFESWYDQENEFPSKKEELDSIKEEYLSDYWIRDAIDSRLPEDASDCERLKLLVDYVNTSKLDLVQSMGACDMKPSKKSIRQNAVIMAKRILRNSGTMTERKKNYQKAKLDFLESWGCENYEEPARSETCSGVVEEGANEPEVLNVELGKTSGTFQFEYETYNVKDRVIVAYENRIIFDSGCVGTDGWKSVSLSYSGQSTQITIRVEPNCAGDSSTKWKFKVGCP